MTTSSTRPRVGPREVVELLTWCRRLATARPDTDPAERATYLDTKTDLLTRITNAGSHDLEEQP